MTDQSWPALSDMTGLIVTYKSWSALAGGKARKSKIFILFMYFLSPLFVILHIYLDWCLMKWVYLRVLELSILWVYPVGFDLQVQWGLKHLDHTPLNFSAKCCTLLGFALLRLPHTMFTFSSFKCTFLHIAPYAEFLLQLCWADSEPVSGAHCLNAN
jgi:hypothetical protein